MESNVCPFDPLYVLPKHDRFEQEEHIPSKQKASPPRSDILEYPETHCLDSPLVIYLFRESWVSRVSAMELVSLVAL